jgi:hypothetical protein
MSTTEIVLNMLAETATKDISKETRPATFEENQEVAHRGGGIAGLARQALGQQTGKPVITSQNAEDFHRLLTDILEDAATIPENTKTE